MFRGGVWGWDQISLEGSPHGGLKRKWPGTACTPFAYLQNMPTKRSITRWCLWPWNSRTTSHSFLVCSIVSSNKREPTQYMMPMPRLEHGWHEHNFYNFWDTVVYCNHLRTERLRGMAGCVLFNQRLIYSLPAIRVTICVVDLSVLRGVVVMELKCNAVSFLVLPCGFRAPGCPSRSSSHFPDSS